ALEQGQLRVICAGQPRRVVRGDDGEHTRHGQGPGGVDRANRPPGDNRRHGPYVRGPVGRVLEGVPGPARNLVRPVHPPRHEPAPAGAAPAGPVRASSQSIRTMTLRARVSLNALPGSGAAAASSASAARPNHCAVAGRPASTRSAVRARHGTGATAPMASRTSLTTPPATSSAAATDTTANAYEVRSRTFRYAELPANASGGISTAVIRSPRSSVVSRSGSSPGSRYSPPSGPVTGSTRGPAGPSTCTTASRAASATA